MKKNKTMIAAFALPATILFVLIFVYPVIRTVFMSFFSIQDRQLQQLGIQRHRQLQGADGQCTVPHQLDQSA